MSESTSVKDVGIAYDTNTRFRTAMEDGHYIDQHFRGSTGALFAVFDGHFGRDVVDIVEEILPRELAKALDELGEDPSPSKIQEALAAAFSTTDSKTEGVTGGSTCVCCLLLNDTESLSRKVLYSANCGDSRAVYSHGETVDVLTYDHKGTDYNEMNRVLDAGGKIKRGRVNTQLAVTRAFGNYKWKQYVISEPYQTRVELLSSHDDCTFLILASDGLWDVVPVQDAVNVCKQQMIQQRHNAQECANELVRLAKEKGSIDNITVMVVALN